MLDVTALILSILLTGAIIFLFIKVYAVQSSLNKQMLEVKSKIGAVIREVNRVNDLKYKVDVSQQTDINKLRTKK